MRDEPFVIRREISLERGNDRRHHTANAMAHDFSGTNEYRRNRNIKHPAADSSLEATKLSGPGVVGGIPRHRI
jgi:hypothetical protein